MTLSSLIDPVLASNSGGVAGRIGYDFQAHVAAAFVLRMIIDPSLVQVECETGDDVTLRWNRDGKAEIEYVQVKSSDDDSKWGIGELTERSKATVGSSIMEKSLKCDAHPGEPFFRFVTSRDVRGDLVLFKVPREKRQPNERFDALVDNFAKKYKTFKSPQGRSTRDWAERMFWEVEGNEDSLEKKNILKLLRLAEDAGESPSSRTAESAYDDLLKRVVAASKASRITAPWAKALPREDAWIWWKSWLLRMRRAGMETLKVYTATPDAFFVNIADVDESSIKRAMQAFDAQFDGGEWRREDLAEYLANWLPEITLPPKVLATFSHLEARNLVKRALEAYGLSDEIAFDRLLAELMLNAILRQYRQSEPIACKLFTKHAGVLHKNSAHIVHTEGTDEIWLGQAHIATADAHDEIVEKIISEISESFNRSVLKREREMIVQLRDPNHLRATNIEHCLSTNAKLDDFMRVLRIPILIAYDSEVIGGGEADDYVDKLIDEVGASYQRIKAVIPPAMADAHIHVFLIPVECAASLVASFGRYLNGK